MVLSPEACTPKAFLSCPMAITSAIPEVNPVTTGLGLNCTSLPNLKSPAISRIRPDMKVAANIPCSPYLPDTIVPRTTAMAPVGPEIWKDPPPRSPEMIPARIAVIRPPAIPIAACSASTLAAPKASARGSATAPTVMPAVTSFKKALLL